MFLSGSISIYIISYNSNLIYIWIEQDNARTSIQSKYILPYVELNITRLLLNSTKHWAIVETAISENITVFSWIKIKSTFDSTEIIHCLWLHQNIPHPPSDHSTHTDIRWSNDISSFLFSPYSNSSSVATCVATKSKK